MPTLPAAARPAAATASATRLPAGSVTARTSAPSWPASTTSTLSPTRIELSGAPAEGVDHGGGDAREQRLEELAQGAAGELVLHGELDAAGALGERLEAPGRGEVPERTFDEAHVDRLGLAVLVARGERLT